MNKIVDVAKLEAKVDREQVKTDRSIKKVEEILIKFWRSLPTWTV